MGGQKACCARVAKPIVSHRSRPGIPTVQAYRVLPRQAIKDQAGLSSHSVRAKRVWIRKRRNWSRCCLVPNQNKCHCDTLAARQVAAWTLFFFFFFVKLNFI
jgi:hypothetical protein